MTPKEARERESLKASLKIIEQVEMLRKFKILYGNEIDCDSLIERLTKNKFECPKCHGKGKVDETYYVHSVFVDDGGYGERKVRTVTCDLCKGQGYTDVEYKPKMVQQGWTT